MFVKFNYLLSQLISEYVLGVVTIHLRGVNPEWLSEDLIRLDQMGVGQALGTNRSIEILAQSAEVVVDTSQV